MDHRSTPPPKGPNDETLDASSCLAAVACAGPRVHLVEGSGLEMSVETRHLLRYRLRIAAFVLCMGFAVFLVWRLIGFDSASDTLGMLVGHGFVTALLGWFAVSLCRPCPGATLVLRIKELLIFGVPALYFLSTQYQWMVLCASERGYLPSPTAAWLVLIFTYTIFIPNTWRRAAMVNSTLAASPILLMGYEWLQDTSCASVLASEGHRLFVEVTLTMIVAAVASTIGVYTINALRVEAFQARQLGQYRLRTRIGSGGMGEVYLAEHQLLKRPCAIKIIRPEKAGDPRILARFEREVQTTAQLSHWNTIDIYDYGRAEDGTFYYVMEYLPGLNLNDLVNRHGPLPPERVIYLLRQACDALAEAHGVGLIHRDIKPANIFTAQRGGFFDVIKLLDFGLARPLSAAGDASRIQLTQDGVITGSPLYMSPEQALGDEPDERSDIYALGAVAYFMLTGQPPFLDDQPLKVLLDHANTMPKPPSALVVGVPEDLEQVVLRCLAKRPDERFSTVIQLAAALDQCDAAQGWSRDLAAQWWLARQPAAARDAVTA